MLKFVKLHQTRIEFKTFKEYDPDLIENCTNRLKNFQKKTTEIPQGIFVVYEGFNSRLIWSLLRLKVTIWTQNYKISKT